MNEASGGFSQTMLRIKNVVGRTVVFPELAELGGGR